MTHKKGLSLTPKTYSHRFFEFDTFQSSIRQYGLDHHFFPEIPGILEEMREHYVDNGNHYIKDIYLKAIEKYLQIIYLNDIRYEGACRLTAKK